jgi:hypothetical protein
LGMGLLAACQPSATGAGAGLPTARPTSETRCEAASARTEAPLVTEWSATERANLESRRSGGAIAVRYVGCDLTVVERCHLTGAYQFRPTTLATDTFEIRDRAELYAKLPVGGFRLEGELSRTGRLAMRTTVVGQYHLSGADLDAVKSSPDCAEATHVVGSIAVGSLSGGDARAVSGGAGVPWLGGGVGTARDESLVRQVGDASSCGAEAAKQETAPSGVGGGPPRTCAAPLQVFLVPLATPAGPLSTAAGRQEVEERRAREQGILVDLPKPTDGERWRLHDAEGKVLCEIPCSRWIPPRSGYFVERVASSRGDGVRIDVPNDWTQSPGARARADFGPEKGLPFLSKLTFYGVGIPSAALSLGLGIAYLASDGSDDHRRSFFALGSVFYGAAAGGAAAFFFLSDDKHFRLKDQATATLPRASFPLRFSGSF